MAKESEAIQLLTDLPPFRLFGVDGKTYENADFDDKNVLIVGITCNHCPYVQAYEERMNALARELQAESVAFLCVNSNDEVRYSEDSFEEMKKRAKEKSFQFLYLRDGDQSFAKAMNAVCTPEFFVYDQDRKLRYHGRLDDHQDPAQVSAHYLKDVARSLLNGEEPKLTQTSAIGCSIKWKA